MDKRKHYTPEQHRIHNRRYEITHVRQIPFKLNIKTDADIIEHLDKLPNRLGYLKELIREDMKRNPL